MHVEVLGTATDDDTAQLAAVLVECVAGGAGVNFLAGLDHPTATAWWRAALAVDDVVTFVARETSGRIVGTVRLVPAPQDNGRHRAEVSKLLVHPDARGQGVAHALLDALEAHALAAGRWLLVLDTESGSDAEHLYRRRGWQVVGVVEDYAADVHGRPHAATFLTTRLST